jgi:4-hydroxy-3-methylbut-2-enyl diphosphate reductase
MPENVRFGLPPEIVQAIASAPGAVTAASMQAASIA